MLPKYQDIMDLIKKGATYEAQEKIMELREGALNLQDENIELKKKIKELESKLEIKENLEYIKPSYWLVNGDNRDGPYCQRCYDVEKILVRLQGGKNDIWRCKSCNSAYEGDAYKDPDLV
jgi:hypothetical protein